MEQTTKYAPMDSSFPHPSAHVSLGPRVTRGIGLVETSSLTAMLSSHVGLPDPMPDGS